MTQPFRGATWLLVHYWHVIAVLCVALTVVRQIAAGRAKARRIDASAAAAFDMCKQVLIENARKGGEPVSGTFDYDECVYTYVYVCVYVFDMGKQVLIENARKGGEPVSGKI